MKRAIITWILLILSVCCIVWWYVMRFVNADMTDIRFMITYWPECVMCGVIWVVTICRPRRR